MFDAKIRRKLEKMLDGIEPEKLQQIADMLKNNEDISEKIDMAKANALLKSLNIEEKSTEDILARAKDELKKNPDFINNLKKS